MLSIEGLSKTYADGTRALTDVSLQVKPGEFVAVLGPSGSGKTTLLRLINGLVEPTAGAVALDGIPVRTLSLEGLLLTKQSVRDKDVMDRVVLQRAIEAAK